MSQVVDFEARATDIDGLFVITMKQVTDERGEFRFPSLGPGVYALEATLEGFSSVSYPNISINVGRNTTIEISN